MLNRFSSLAVGLAALTATIDSTPSLYAQQARSSKVSMHDSLRADILKEATIVERHFNHVKKVVAFARPAVVHIEATKIEKQGNRSSRTIDEVGAGVIFKRMGGTYVMTNRHVIHGAPNESILVRFSDGRFFNPINVLLDSGTDIAVMEIPSEDATPCIVGDSDKMDVGDFVIAIGSPFGLNHSVSYGIISAKGRRDLQLGNEGVKYQDFLQTDAAINPGNSGGPLINLRGEVIGINTAIASNSGRNEGIGFTIPINMAMHVADQLVENGSVARAFLGVSLDTEFTPEKATTIGLRSIYGARVISVTRGSPAEVAQLQSGDVILEFNGRLIEDDDHLVSQVSLTPIGSEVPVVVYRSGMRNTVRIKVTDRKLFDPQN